MTVLTQIIGGTTGQSTGKDVRNTINDLIAQVARLTKLIPTVTWDSTVNFVIVGNSFIGPATGTPYLPNAILASAPFAGSGATSAVLGHSGYSWSQLDGVGSEVDAAFVAGKVNILLVGETTNSMFNTPFNDVPTTIAQAKTYIANRKAAKAWDRIVVFGTIPRQDIQRSPATTLVTNSLMDQVNADMKANPDAYGITGFIDVRPGTPFDFPDYNDSTFGAAGRSEYYQENLNSKVHPNAAGASVIAGRISQYLRTMPLPGATAVTLGALTLVGIVVNGKAGTYAISGATSGSTITSSVSGLVINNASRTATWDGTTAASTVAAALTETHPTATNSGRTSPLTIAPAGTVNYVRLNTLSAAFLETALSPGYSYAADAYTQYYGTNKYGVSTSKLPAGLDGYVRSRKNGANSQVGAMVGFSSVPSPAGFPSATQGSLVVYHDNSAFNNNTGGNWQVASDGGGLSGSVLLNLVPVADGDLTQVRRAGTQLIAEVSKDGGATFTALYARTAPTGSLYPFAQSGNSAANGGGTGPLTASPNVG